MSLQQLQRLARIGKLTTEDLIQQESQDRPRAILSSSDEGTIKLWDVLTGQETLTLRSYKGAIKAAIISQDH